MEFGCCVELDRYDDLVRLGYDFIELPGSSIYKMSESEFQKAIKLFNKSNVKCVAFNKFLHPDIKVVGPKTDKVKTEEYIDKVIHRGSQIGIKSIGFGSPFSRTIPEGFSREKAVEQLVYFIEIACNKADKYGIRILLEPLSKIETNFINNIDDALFILSNIKSKNKGILVDYYHFCLENEEMKKLNNKLIKLLYHVHIAEKEGRTYLSPKKHIKYLGFIKRLKYIGYNGRVSIEANYTNYEKEGLVSLNLLKEIDKVT